MTSERITEAELQAMEAFDPHREPPEASEDMVRLVAEVRRLRRLLMAIAETETIKHTTAGDGCAWCRLDAEAVRAEEQRR